MIEEMKTKDYASLLPEEKTAWLYKLQEAHVSSLMESLRTGEFKLRKIENEKGKNDTN